MALTIERYFLRIQSAGNILRQHTVYIGLQFFCIRMGGQGVQVGHHEITFKFILHPDIVPHRPEIVAEV